ncbi:hypothetical protein B0A48_09635 [Cryoendolithus antarcticus]|uniref:Spindle pole body-associated protein cut12 domain-containing protein n=1 Tax=Cryoendolithus antarcticus TaxID=1507870 RepID=A0A1V8T0M5_9PEZI|nr:hypothetical protein B0A48_09635 [Cryoendolithus antarcticus]
MLHWLAGAKAPEGGGEAEPATFIDAPDTPAPVFAVRAFKHAIFGTPQTAQPKPRRHSHTERDRQRPIPTAGRAPRPQMTRPKSSSDAITFAAKQAAALPDPVASPTKGILMTPGTANARRKTVTFGDHVDDEGAKKAMDGSKSGLPADFPGKFPSPWVAAAGALEGDEIARGARERGRSKLTEELHRVRDESAKRNFETQATDTASVDGNASVDMEEPTSQSGIYWKREYDIYRANTTREVKKLVTKQRAAKGFAREKDQQCTELADELRQEKKKVDKLQKRAAELEAQLKALQVQLKMDAASAAVATRDTGKPAVTARATRAFELEARLETSAPPADLEAYVSSIVGAPAAKPDAKSSRPNRTRHRAGNLPTDIWTNQLVSSSPVAAQNAHRLDNSRVTGRAVTSGTNVAPSVNVTNVAERANLSAAQRSLPALPHVHIGKESQIAETTISKATTDRRDSLSPSHAPPRSNGPLSQVSSNHDDSATAAADRPPSPPKHEQKDLPEPPMSSPFQSDVVLGQPASPTRPRSVLADRLARSTIDHKENINPKTTVSMQLPGKETLVVPRQVDVTADGGLRDRKGREVSADRIAAAKARLAARSESRTFAS